MQPTKRQVDLNLSLASKLTLLFSSDRQGNVLGMVQDIADCLVWARESGPKFNFDKVQKNFKPLSDCTATKSVHIFIIKLLTLKCSVCCPVQDNIFLIGHSAGAHLCALTTLFLTDEREELFIDAGVQRKVAHSVRGVFGKDHCAVHHTASSYVYSIYTWLVLPGQG